MTGRTICRFLALTDFASQHCGERWGFKIWNEASTEMGDNAVRKERGPGRKNKEQPAGLFFHRLRPPARVHINRRFSGASVGAEAQP